MNKNIYYGLVAQKAQLDTDESIVERLERIEETTGGIKSQVVRDLGTTRMTKHFPPLPSKKENLLDAVDYNLYQINAGKLDGHDTDQAKIMELIQEYNKK